MQSEADARQAAVADASFAATRAAQGISLGFDTFRATSAPTAASPSIGQIFTNPTACNLSYAPIAAFDTGHIDILRLDGSVVCSSLKTAHVASLRRSDLAGRHGAGRRSTDLPMRPMEIRLSCTHTRFPERGSWPGFSTSNQLGPKLASEYGSGAHQLEFLVTSSDGSAVVTRSIDSGRWTGATIAGTPFAQSSGFPDRNDVTGTARWYGQAAVRCRRVEGVRRGRQGGRPCSCGPAPEPAVRDRCRRPSRRAAGSACRLSQSRPPD